MAKQRIALCGEGRPLQLPRKSRGDHRRPDPAKAGTNRGNERERQPANASMINLSSHLRQHLPATDTFDWVMASQGTIYREVKNRRTLELEIGGRRYFNKIYRGCGWREIFKDLFQARVPVTSAQPEWRAMEKLRDLGVPTLVVAGKGMRGLNPAARESFVITEALEGMISLEKLLEQ